MVRALDSALLKDLKAAEKSLANRFWGFRDRTFLREKRCGVSFFNGGGGGGRCEWHAGGGALADERLLSDKGRHF